LPAAADESADPPSVIRMDHNVADIRTVGLTEDTRFIERDKDR
jgi:hypothetical protein